MIAFKPKKIKLPSLLTNGQHNVTIVSAGEIADNIILKFANEHGFYNLCIKMDHGVIEKLSRIISIGSGKFTENMTLNAFLGLKYTIIIQDNYLSKIKRPQ